MKTPSSIYQLKITLLHVSPPVWRRVQVATETSLPKLHEVVQRAMGWTNTHLHAFRIGNELYGPPDPEMDTRDYRRIKLEDVAAERGRFIYEYDFGDGWEHELLVEKVLAPEPGTKYPVCLAGKRAGPPEDCGGPYGYAELLRILRDPKHAEHEERKEWVGPHFAPEEFDLAFVNEEIRSRRKLVGWE
ncbi:MAG TPA: plasmid pRiA4b ORF-3 family protein [Myxococcales bacterium]|nr:plasmid pRiA4b ORF-3 family protein [Myxococcales bacterium]